MSGSELQPHEKFNEMFDNLSIDDVINFELTTVPGNSMEFVSYKISVVLELLDNYDMLQRYRNMSEELSIESYTLNKHKSRS